ncbi:helix-turn-helix domain-containing protein [Cytobacillus praedii]|uniref:helix-turn-helix domain-containing protein n=1 Tax=Cytobacillus praedii TaxID=1742358 RepID=UPI003F8087EC
MEFFLKELSKKNKIFEELREEYGTWRNELQEINKPFFMIPSDFKHIFLRDISGGALKLFLFLGFHSKYNTGESWYTLEQVGAFFKKDPRTIANWFKELEDKGLIFRGQKGFTMKANTFLKPYGFSFDEMKTDLYSDFTHVLQDVERSLSLDYKPVLGLLLNYSLKEYTFLLVYQKENEFPCSCFYNFDEETIRTLRAKLKKYNIPIDNFDIDSPITSSNNKIQTIYNYLMKYLDEQSM